MDIFFDVEDRRLPFYVGIGGDDEFFEDIIVPDAIEELLEVETIRHTPVNRGDRTAEDVVVSFENTKAFDGEHVEVVLDDTEEARIAGSVCTDGTDGPGGVCESETGRTLVDIRLELVEFPCEVSDIGSIGLQQKKREFGRGLLPDAGHIGDEIDEALKSFWHGKKII